MAFLELKNIYKSYYLDKEEFPVLKGINLQFDRGEFVSILGESGGGKSTLMNIIGGLDRNFEGEVLVNGKLLDHKKEKQLDNYRRATVGYIYQSYNLISHLTVLDNVLVALDMTTLTKEERRKRALELLDKVGLSEQVKKHPNHLSGGQKQRVAIARALASDPQIIIADEPTTALDVTIQAQILDLLKEIQKESHSGIVLITHDLGVVAETADQVAVMYAGQIVEKADVKTIFENPLHPYTRSLLHSMPQTDDESEDLHVIHGTVPSLINMPRTGDRFAARIPWIPASAHEENPKIHEVEPGHFVRCTCWQSFHFQDEEKKG